jgi:hypothetical protein
MPLEFPKGKIILDKEKCFYYKPITEENLLETVDLIVDV